MNERHRWEAEARAAAETAALRAGFARWVGGICFEHFLTVTFKPSQRGLPHGLAFCRRNLARYLEEVAGIVGREEAAALVVRSPIFGLVVWERTQRGDWHAHLLLAGGRLDYSRLIAVAVADAAVGRVHVEPVRSGEGLGGYLSGYVSKDLSGDGWDLVGEWPKGGFAA